MRALSPEMQARLAGEVTTFCHCWKILRRDGVMQGFTDHDEDVVFDHVTYQASSGLLAHGREDHLGFSAGKADVSGALTQLEIAEPDLASGAYDGASVETWFVDWRDPSFRVLLEIETIGEVRRGENFFHAELRALSHVMDQETGRRYLKSCSADLFDARCGVSIHDPKFCGQGVIASVQTAAQFAVTLSGFSDGWFTGGHISLNADQLHGEIRSHRQTGSVAHIQIWTPLTPVPNVGDAITLRAGCDKSFATCGTKFGNRAHFRGFPHIPGNDVLFSGPNTSAVMDGGSLFK